MLDLKKIQIDKVLQRSVGNNFLIYSAQINVDHTSGQATVDERNVQLPTGVEKGTRIRIENKELDLPKHIKYPLEIDNTFVFIIVDITIGNFYLGIYQKNEKHFLELDYQNIFNVTLAIFKSIRFEIDNAEFKDTKISNEVLFFSAKLLLICPVFSEAGKSNTREHFNTTERPPKIVFLAVEDEIFKNKIIPKNGIDQMYMKNNLFKKFLEENREAKEDVFQSFFEKDLFLVGIEGKNHQAHPKYFRYADKKKKNIKGHSRNIPDFLYKSVQNEWVVVEIERPNKEMITQSGQASSLATGVFEQIKEWKLLIKQNGESMERKYPGITTKCSYIIIAGSDVEFERKNLDKNSFFELNANETNTVLLTYEDLIKNNYDFIEHLRVTTLKLSDLEN